MSERITWQEFKEEGFLQEVNRRFLHPLGLALTVDVDPATDEIDVYVQDAREDPEGFVFNFATRDPSTWDESLAKRYRVEAEWLRRVEARSAMFGGRVIEPIPGTPNA